MTEKEMVKNAQKGDKEAFAQLYALYKNKLYRYAFYRLGNQEDARDAVADTIVSAFEGIKQLKSAQAFPSWIFTILRASCNSYIKQQIKMRESEELEALDNSTRLSVEFNEAAIELKQALAQLKDDEREIVLLSVVGGLNSKEIAKIAQLTSGSVRSKLSRSLGKMRAYLENDEVKI